MRSIPYLILGISFVLGACLCTCQKPAPKTIEPQAGAASLAHLVRKQGRFLSIHALGAEPVADHDHVDILLCAEEPRSRQKVVVTVLQNVVVIQKGAEEVKVLVLPEEAELLMLGQKYGTLQLALRNPEDIGAQEVHTVARLEDILLAERIKALEKRRREGFQRLHTEKPAPGTGKLAGRITQSARAFVLPVSGAEMVKAGDHVDLLAALEDPKVGQPFTATLATDLIVMADRGRQMDGKLCLLALPEEAELLFLASQTGSLHCALRNPDDIGSEEPRARATIETLLTGERVKALKKKRCATLQVIRGGPIAAAIYEGPAATNTEQYADHGVNGWVDTAADRLSTFAVDVDTAAYTIARRKLEQGALPPPEAVRTEEFINYFRYDYPRPDGNDAPFHVALEAAPSPFDSGRHILRVGLRGIDAGEQAHKPAHLTFLVDTSGSMQSADKIGMVKRSLRFLVDQLEDGDTVALCTYAGEVREVLRPTGMERRAEIHSAIEELSAGGSTAMASGLALAYALAYRNFQPDAINRVIVCSDGDANVGATEHGDMLESIAHFASAGITLSTVGFGMGNYKDHEMEQLADKGNGNYSYIDTFSQAKRVFGEQLMGTLQVIAKDVKVQVEFNPRTVTRYRLIGYENRDIADEDFREDKVDAGEIGAGHMVTALYEIESSNPRGHLATVRVRWKQPEGGRADERAFDLEPDHMAQDFEQASPDFKRAVAAAALAENLRNSPFKKTWTLEIAGRVAAAGAGQKADADDRELLAMIGKVQILTEKR